MAGYQLYLPKVTGANNKALTDRGLDRISAESNWTHMDRGPDGGQGSLVFWGQPFSDCQWHEAPAIPEFNQPPGSYYVGVQGKVDPDELLNGSLINCCAVPLADGQAWRFPYVERLPKTQGLDRETGRFIRRVSAQYQEFYSLGLRTSQAVMEGLDVLEEWQQKHPEKKLCREVVAEDGWKFVTLGLCMLYRLTPEIISILGLIDDHACVRAICLSIELPTMLELEEPGKKKEDTLYIPVTSKL